MNKVKVCIIGNSVALRVRPVQKTPLNKNYTYFLDELLRVQFPKKQIIIENLAFSRACLDDVILDLDNYINSFPNYYIINLGVVDASTREIPFWYAQILNNKKESFLKFIFASIHARIIVPFRSFFVKIRGKKTWKSIHYFENKYNELVSTLIKETNAKIILLEINPSTSAIESKLPGSLNSYIEFNKIIKKIAANYDCPFISLEDVKKESYFPDGIHFSYEGHKIVANKICELIK